MPMLLKIIMKIIYECVLENFTIEKDNYRPLNTVLIFNFISSPRTQKVYGIKPEKFTFIKSFNRILCNTGFNVQFGEKDQLNCFNKDIEKYNKKINDFMENNILTIDEKSSEAKKYLGKFFWDYNFNYPDFMFNSDCDFLCQFLVEEK